MGVPVNLARAMAAGWRERPGDAPRARAAGVRTGLDAQRAPGQAARDGDADNLNRGRHAHCAYAL